MLPPLLYTLAGSLFTAPQPWYSSSSFSYTNFTNTDHSLSLKISLLIFLHLCFRFTFFQLLFLLILSQYHSGHSFNSFSHVYSYSFLAPLLALSSLSLFYFTSFSFQTSIIFHCKPPCLLSSRHSIPPVTTPPFSLFPCFVA